MNPCWVLIVARGLKVWLPPEVYLQRELATKEAARWRDTFRLPGKPPPLTPRARGLHVIQTLFPEPWRACPVWVGVTWSERSYPRLKIELMPADAEEAATWLRRRTPKTVEIAGPGQVEFHRRGVLASAGIFRVKRVMGF